MLNQTKDQSVSSNASKVRVPYEAPAIIYEGLITTRAGSVNSADDSFRDAQKSKGTTADSIFGN